MLDVKKCLKLKNVAVFASGVLFGTAGIKVLGSQDAKKLYINCLAAGLRAKECVMTTASNIQANAEDVLAEAKEINRARAEEEFGEEEETAEDLTETAENTEDAELIIMKTGIRFTVKHEIRGRIRIHLTRGRLSIRQADLFSFYLASLPQVTAAMVYERIGDAAISYTGTKEDLIAEILKFSFDDEKLNELVRQPEPER